MKYADSSLTQEQRDLITAAIREKVPRMQGCPMCGTARWNLADGLIFLVLQGSSEVLHIAGKGLPSCALICENCGNTQLLNIKVLGLDIEQFGLLPLEQEQVSS